MQHILIILIILFLGILMSMTMIERPRPASRVSFAPLAHERVFDQASGTIVGELVHPI